MVKVVEGPELQAEVILAAVSREQEGCVENQKKPCRGQGGLERQVRMGGGIRASRWKREELIRWCHNQFCVLE